MALWGESDVISADERKGKNESEGPRSEYIKGYRDWKSYRITCIHPFDGSDALTGALQDARSRHVAIPPGCQLERNPLEFESGESFETTFGIC
jgi:hypothetical protein